MAASTPSPAPDLFDRPRRPRAAVLAVALLIGSAAVSGGVIGRATTPAQHTAARAAPADRPVTARPVRQRLADVREGTCTIQAESHDLAVPDGGVAGVVTAVDLRAGRPIIPLARVAEISGRPLIAVDLPFRLYRTLAPFDTGPDVRAVQDALIRGGRLQGPASATFDEATQGAVARLYRDIGSSPPTSGADAQQRLDAASAAVAAIDSQLAAGTTVARSEIDRAVAERTVARRAIGTTLPQAEIVVRPTGTVRQLQVKVGSSIGPGKVLASLADGGATASCQLTSSAAAGLHGGAAAVLRPGASKPIRGRIGRLTDAEGSVTTSFAPSSARLSATHAGAQATLQITVVATAGQVLTVPASALREGARGSTVWVTTASGHREVRVTTGLVAGGWVAISPGPLTTRDRVVVADAQGG